MKTELCYIRIKSAHSFKYDNFDITERKYSFEYPRIKTIYKFDYDAFDNIKKRYSYPFNYIQSKTAHSFKYDNFDITERKYSFEYPRIKTIYKFDYDIFASLKKRYSYPFQSLATKIAYRFEYNILDSGKKIGVYPFHYLRVEVLYGFKYTIVDFEKRRSFYRFHYLQIKSIYEFECENYFELIKSKKENLLYLLTDDLYREKQEVIIYKERNDLYREKQEAIIYKERNELHREKQKAIISKERGEIDAANRGVFLYKIMNKVEKCREYALQQSLYKLDVKHIYELSRNKLAMHREISSQLSRNKFIIQKETDVVLFGTELNLKKETSHAIFRGELTVQKERSRDLSKNIFSASRSVGKEISSIIHHVYAEKNWNLSSVTINFLYETCQNIIDRNLQNMVNHTGIYLSDWANGEIETLDKRVSLNFAEWQGLLIQTARMLYPSEILCMKKMDSQWLDFLKLEIYEEESSRLMQKDEIALTREEILFLDLGDIGRKLQLSHSEILFCVLMVVKIQSISSYLLTMMLGEIWNGVLERAFRKIGIEELRIGNSEQIFRKISLETQKVCPERFGENVTELETGLDFSEKFLEGNIALEVRKDLNEKPIEMESKFESQIDFSEKFLELIINLETRIDFSEKYMEPNAEMKVYLETLVKHIEMDTILEIRIGSLEKNIGIDIERKMQVNFVYRLSEVFARTEILKEMSEKYANAEKNKIEPVLSEDILLDREENFIYKSLAKLLESDVFAVQFEKPQALEKFIPDIHINKYVCSISKKMDAQIFAQKNNTALKMYKRGWFLRRTEPTDLIIIPNIDYDYEGNPVEIDSYYEDWDVYYWHFGKSKSVVESHSIPQGVALGCAHIEVSIEILVDMVNMVLMLWEKFYTAFEGLHGVGSIKSLMIVIYNWLMLETSVDEMKEKGSYEDYMRCYRWLRWEAEMIINKARIDYELGGNRWIELYILELFRYLYKHHFDAMPLFKLVAKMDFMRNIFKDAQGDIDIVLDKIKGKRFYNL